MIGMIKLSERVVFYVKDIRLIEEALIEKKKELEKLGEVKSSSFSIKRRKGEFYGIIQIDITYNSAADLIDEYIGE